jgi:hypothetical protein
VRAANIDHKDFHATIMNSYWTRFGARSVFGASNIHLLMPPPLTDSGNVRGFPDANRATRVSKWSTSI